MIGIVRENITDKYLIVKSVRMDLEIEDITKEPGLDEGSVAFENYRRKTEVNKAFVSVELDSNQQFKNSLLATFQKHWKTEVNLWSEISDLLPKNLSLK